LASFNSRILDKIMLAISSLDRRDVCSSKKLFLFFYKLALLHWHQTPYLGLVA